MNWYTPRPCSPALDPFVVCAWTAQPSGRHQLTPDGCSDLLELSTGEVLLCGAETRSWTFELPPGITAVGLRFRPGAAATVFDLDASTITDRRIRLAPLHDRHASVHTDDNRLEALEQSVLGRVTANDLRPDALVTQIAELVTSSPHMTIAAIAAELAMGERTMHRRSLRAFGFGVATLTRIVRFQRFLATAAVNGGLSLGELAGLAGYSDQSHLSRDCRAITSRTVRQFVHDYFPTFPDMSDPYKTGTVFPTKLTS